MPRPETELLVELALEHSRDDAAFSLADLGTGSGAIAIALACELKATRIAATDNSDAALQVARENAGRLCPGRIDFRLGDWFRPLAGEHFDMIVSNPPYVTADDPVLRTTELQHEPRNALAAGPDGLDHLRVLIDGARHCLNPRGRLLLEHGAGQDRALRTLLGRGGYRAIETHTDMAGLARITMAQWPG
ncbi:MAG: HemK/PrmC family methyltransferase [Gammaproteobacteria bacterium]|nr:HemK/PrmC family methyltransferase [Gammaproteobacteria bacterium]